MAITPKKHKHLCIGGNQCTFLLYQQKGDKC